MFNQSVIMISTTPDLPPSGVFLSYPGEEQPGLTRADLDAGRAFIDDQLPELICDPTKITNKLAIPLEHPFVVPSNRPVEGFSYKEQQFYWDSYFVAARWLMLQGDKHYGLAKGMLENLTSMFERFGVIPNSSVYNRLGRSQPPFLTSYIFDMYDTYRKSHPDEINDQWLAEKIAIAKQEYSTVWMGTEDPHNRQVYRGLSRYYDVDVTDDNIEAESGHDYTPRFGGKASQYLPVDLNAELFQYEMHFARAAVIAGNKPEELHWRQTATMRGQVMYEEMYDPKTGLYRDKNFRTGEWGPVASLASYVPMWAGMVKPRSRQAHEMIGALKLFEQPGGLAVTEPYIIDPKEKPLQWGFPNRWSPSTMLVTDGLERCSFPDEARRIGLVSLAGNIGWFRDHGEFLEAYNAADPTAFPIDGVYPRQRGFGWTDAETEYYSVRYVENRQLPAAAMRGAVLLDPPLNP